MHLTTSPLVLALIAVGCAHEQTTAASPPPPAQPAVAEAPPPTPAPAPAPARDDSTDLERLLSKPIAHFAFDRADLTPEDQQQLQALATALRAHPGTRIQIAGNCDERGTEEYNLQLGQRRAGVASRYLVQLGVSAEQLDTISYGEERPIDPAHNEQAWAANRRDDGTIQTPTQASTSAR